MPLQKSLLGALIPHMHVILSLLGVVLLVVAGFLAGIVIGFIAAGIACLVLAFYAESEARP